MTVQHEIVLWPSLLNKRWGYIMQTQLLNMIGPNETRSDTKRQYRTAQVDVGKDERLGEVGRFGMKSEGSRGLGRTKDFRYTIYLRID